MKSLNRGFIIILITLISCNQSENRISELERKNLELQNELLAFQKENSKSTYVFAVITVSLPSHQDGMNGKYKDWREESFVSPIEEFIDFSEESEYRYLDNIEKKYRKTKAFNWPIKFSERKIYKFDSYSDASKSIRKLNGD